MITMTGVSSRSARRAISSPSALPYRSDQRVTLVKARFGFGSSGKARIGQGLHVKERVMDSILKAAPSSSIQSNRRHSRA